MTHERMLQILSQIESEATPAAWQTMVQDQWIELRNPDTGEKYSLAEFTEGHERDQELYYESRRAMKWLLALGAEAIAARRRAEDPTEEAMNSHIKAQAASDRLLEQAW